jgi:hypothetical protein
MSRQGYPVADETAQALIKRFDVDVCDGGLFPDRPQSWSLEKTATTTQTKGTDQ